MISPEEIRERARKLWSSGRALRASLGADPLFPYLVPFAKPSAREWLQGFAELRVAVERLEAESKSVTRAGYWLVMRDVAHQKLGTLRIPERIVFESVEDVAACAGERAGLARFNALAQFLRWREPRLAQWLAERPLRALEFEAAMPRLLDIVAYFGSHPRPMRFVRELGIVGVDSKFIEAHQALLSELLERVLPPEALDQTVRGVADYGFERRFGLRYEEPLIRFRWLDESRALAGSITDASVPLSQLATYAPACDRVFVTENKINFLTLPGCERGLALFGSGYAIERLSRVPWLHKTALHYWGDIDTHGFAILSRLRTYLPHARSFLMDRETLLLHRELWSEEPPNGRCTRDLDLLIQDEHDLYDDLRRDRLGVCVRLEQERIVYPHVTEAVRGI